MVICIWGISDEHGAYVTGWTAIGPVFGYAPEDAVDFADETRAKTVIRRHREALSKCYVVKLGLLLA